MGKSLATRNMAKGIHLSLALKQKAHPNLGQFAKKRIHRPIKMPQLQQQL